MRAAGAFQKIIQSMARVGKKFKKNCTWTFLKPVTEIIYSSSDRYRLPRTDYNLSNFKKFY